MVKPAECLETKKFLKIHHYTADIRVRKSSKKPTIPGHYELNLYSDGVEQPCTEIECEVDEHLCVNLG